MNNNQNTDITFLDGLFNHVIETNVVKQETIKLIIEFMKNNQYDTDAFREDWNTKPEQSNLFNICTGFTSTCNQFMTQLQCMFKFPLCEHSALVHIIFFCHIINSGIYVLFNWTNIWILVRLER